MKVYLIVFDDNLLSHDEAFSSREEAEKCLEDYIESEKEVAILHGSSEEEYRSYYSILEIKVV